MNVFWLVWSCVWAVIIAVELKRSGNNRAVNGFCLAIVLQGGWDAAMKLL